jgi:hypothetical protein
MGGGKGGMPRSRQNVYLALAGVCGSCASLMVTMKMGTNRVLREKFGNTIREVVQVDSRVALGEGGKATSLTMEAVHAEVDRMLQAITARVVRISGVDLEFGVVKSNYQGPN